MNDALTTQQTLSPLFYLIMQFVLLFIFIVIPVALVKAFWSNWVAYVRGTFFAAQKYKVLELKVPRGIAKSPLAMELFITSLYQTGGEGTWYDKYWNGSTRPWFSLEITSIDGVVRFFIWTREKFKDVVETQLYGQFPDIEIMDVEDYSTQMPFDPQKYQYWGCEFIKTADSHLPIKTYIDYGLDKDPEEEVKIDPITSLIEFLGSVQRGEQVWIQIVVRAHVKDMVKKEKFGDRFNRFLEKGKWREKVDWKEAANADLKKRTKRDLEAKPDKPLSAASTSLTKGEKNAVDAIENSLSKIPFDCGIRAIYVARSDAFRSSLIPGLSGVFRQYNSNNLNGFKTERTPSVTYPWQDRSGKKVLKLKKELFDQYQHRAFFYSDYVPVPYFSKDDTKAFIMTTEELATVYHFPGDVSRTPTLSRVVAKKSEPPANLPI